MKSCSDALSRDAPTAVAPEYVLGDKVVRRTIWALDCDSHLVDGFVNFDSSFTEPEVDQPGGNYVFTQHLLYDGLRNLLT